MSGVKGQNRPNKYTNEDLLNIIRSFVKNNGRAPKRREIAQSSVINSRFGSFNEAVRLAGFGLDMVLHFYKKSR